MQDCKFVNNVTSIQVEREPVTSLLMLSFSVHLSTQRQTVREPMQPRSFVNKGRSSQLF